MSHHDPELVAAIRILTGRVDVLLHANHLLTTKVITMSAATDKLTATVSRLEGAATTLVSEVQDLASRHDDLNTDANAADEAVLDIDTRLSKLADTLQGAADQAKSAQTTGVAQGQASTDLPLADVAATPVATVDPVTGLPVDAAPAA